MMKTLLLLLLLPITIRAQSTTVVTCPPGTTPVVSTAGQVVTVNCGSAPFSITTPVTFPVAKVGTPYSVDLSKLANPKGGVAPYSYSATLPAGFALSSAGLLTGTPTKSNVPGFNVVFTVKDSIGVTKQSQLGVQVK